MAFYHTQPIRFHCTKCSQCCYGDKHAYVRANKHEVENIRLFLEIDAATFETDYLIKLVDQGYGIQMKHSPFAKAMGVQGHCILLNKEGKCSVYSVRPTQCRTYPFWPEILISEEQWNSEASRCEGINQGEIIELKHIEKQKVLSTLADVIISENKPKL